MKFAVPQEAEARVALTPDVAKALIKKGHQISVQAGAGTQAFILDQEYADAGCEIVSDLAALFQKADCILKVNPPTDKELTLIPEGKALISVLWASRNPKLVEALKNRKITSFGMDAIPRISRAQSMDILSSMSTITGYKAVLLAATHLGKFLPMLTTAAGTIRPSKGLIIGAGVAGLQAIATARRLGAVVEAFDTRPVTKEQVQSLGATFIELPHAEGSGQDASGYAKEHSAEYIEKEKKLLHEHVKAADFVVTTALIPGKPAPRLITKEMVADMKPGSVIVDLAAETGGNCELTKADQVTVVGGVTILGPVNLAATMPLDASRMYARNMASFINQIINEKGFTWDEKDEVFTQTCITRGTR
jgi:H+-translocating NAD(P) transhydrogenase subunit alpha